ncbi:MAG: isoaspartyl peptidase/L-asparaginase, partial [Planctomycetota bacterium]
MKSLSAVVGLLFALLLAAVGNRASAEKWAIALHGGAGSLSRDLPSEKQAEYHEVLKDCLAAGVSVLSEGGSALDAVEQTVIALEDCPLFNAGRGSVFDEEGGHSMDASIMDGRTLACGGVTGVKTLRNPIQGARVVMEQTPHVLMAGPRAEQLAARHSARLAPPSYFSTGRRFGVLREVMEETGRTPPSKPLYGWPAGESAPVQETNSEARPGGTVGCVALDVSGTLAAATSTGGLSGKLVGRIGDSPIPGAGNYANRFAAVGGTGTGEEYIRNVATARVAMLVELG